MKLYPFRLLAIIVIMNFTCIKPCPCFASPEKQPNALALLLMSIQYAQQVQKAQKEQLLSQGYLPHIKPMTQEKKSHTTPAKQHAP